MDQRSQIAEKLQSKQIFAPDDPTLAHDIGLFHYWWAKALEREGALDAAGETWRQVIANWAIVLEDDAFWQNWCGRRSEVYGVDISEDDIQTVRDQLKEKLGADLASYSSHCNKEAWNDKTSNDGPLDVLFDLEIRAIQALKRVDGFPVSDDAGEKVICGPIMLRRLGLSSAFSQFIAGLAPVDSQASDMFARMLQQFVDEALGRPPLDTKARRKLMQYFSQLGTPTVYLNRSQPLQALDVLSTRCHHTVIPVDRLADVEGEGIEQLP